MTHYALERRFPALSDTLDKVVLTELPTPLQAADELADRLGIARLHIKRDDLSATAYGGNKVRKLEYLLGEALARQCDAVVTFGAVGSNHVLATAIYAARLGLQCHAVLTAQPVTPYVARTLRYHAALGTRLWLADGYQGSLQIAEQLAADHPTGPERLYVIPWGGSSPLGTVGFVNAALELAEQTRDAPPDVIYVACGTMGTVAGLELGLRLAGLNTRIEAIRVVPEPVTTDFGIRKLFTAANQLLHDRANELPLLDHADTAVSVRGEFFGPGYAEATPECREAVALMQSTTALNLETTYTGKALAALIHDARNGLLKNKHAVFWHTYNSRPYPADVADQDATSLPDWTQSYLQQA